MTGSAYYPIFANLRGRRCVVIGGGLVAQRKVTTLLFYGAAITVISPSLTRRLAAAAARGRLRHLARRFRPGDLRGAWLVYAATDEQAINRAVWREALRRRVFANVVDQPALCSFIAPSILRRGLLTIAVSTGGASPSVAKLLRRDLERTVGAEYAPMLRLLRGLRDVAKERLPGYGDRKRYFEAVVRGRVFRLVRSGQVRRARREALRLLTAQAGHNGRGARS